MVDDGRTTDGRTTEHGYTISSPCEPDGSGELKNLFSHGVAHQYHTSYPETTNATDSHHPAVGHLLVILSHIGCLS